LLYGLKGLQKYQVYALTYWDRLIVLSLPDGIMIVTTATHHVFNLQLYRGNRRIDLETFATPSVWPSLAAG
jgi:hypothetical protein